MRRLSLHESASSEYQLSLSAIKFFRATKKIHRLLLAAAGVALALLTVLAACVYCASQRAPAFYRQALAASSSEAAQQGDRFERVALTLHNAAHHAGRWEASLSADEINGWLAIDLPAKFPRLMPTGISDPRVAIDGDLIRLAVRYNRGGVNTVLSISGETYLTAQTNEIAIRLDHARAGLVPIPLGRVIEEISDRAERADVNLRWTEVKGSPVALLRLALDSGDDRRVVLDRLHTASGQVLLAGRTELAAPALDGDKQQSTAGQSDKTTRQR